MNVAYYFPGLDLRSIVFQHEIEPPENQKSKELSASALKNKKKREAKARSKKEKEVCWSLLSQDVNDKVSKEINQ